MADQDDVRRIALALPDVEEADDRFAFSVRGKGIAWIYLAREAPKQPRIPHPDVVAVRTDGLAEKQVLVESSPAIYFDDDHYKNFPAVLVRLPEIGLDELAEVITDGWRLQAPRRLVKQYDAEHGGE